MKLIHNPKNDITEILSSHKGWVERMGGVYEVKFVAVFSNNEGVLVWVAEEDEGRALLHKQMAIKMLERIPNAVFFGAGMLRVKNGESRFDSDSCYNQFGRDRPTGWDAPQQNEFLSELSQKFLRILRGDE